MKRLCTKCNGTGKLPHWLFWKKVCSACSGNGILIKYSTPDYRSVIFPESSIRRPSSVNPRPSRSRLSVVNPRPQSLNKDDIFDGNLIPITLAVLSNDDSAKKIECFPEFT